MNKYEKFCIEEAAFYADKAHHILTEEMKDPKKYYDEMIDTYKHLIKMFPFGSTFQEYCNLLMCS